MLTLKQLNKLHKKIKKSYGKDSGLYYVFKLDKDGNMITNKNHPLYKKSVGEARKIIDNL